MSKNHANRFLGILFVVGVLLRLVAWRIEPPHHPDEYYQYIEPAWLRLTGMGVEPWEWRDGVRSWVLPAYNGAWMALLRQCGLAGGVLTEIVQLHWALISLTLVWAGWRGGLGLARRIILDAPSTDLVSARSNDAPIGWQGGLIGAGICATFPLLVMQAPHTFSETPSMLTLVWSIVLALEAVESSSTRKIVLSGIFASAGVCFRIANGPVAIVPLVIVFAARKWKLLVPFVLSGIAPVIFFGFVDLLTWGGFLSSYFGYIRFNFIEGKAASFGTSPGDWYWRIIIDRLPTTVFVLFLCIYKLRKFTWPYIVASFGLLVYLTTQAHKEERFIVLFWPFFMIAVAGSVGGWLGKLQLDDREVTQTFLRRIIYSARPGRVQALASILLVLVIFADSLLHSARKELDITRSLESKTDYSRGLIDAQSWVGTRKDLVGIVIEQMGAGYSWVGASVPLVKLDKNVRHSLVRNPVLNYAIVMHDSQNEDLVKTSGYSLVRSFGNYNVFRKDILSN